MTLQAEPSTVGATVAATPPNPNGSLGEAFIDGAHKILMGPSRGDVKILFRNTDMNEFFVDRIAASFASHLY
jgi:hypothetical protein